MKTIDERVKEAIAKNKQGYNCAQAVACAYSDLLGMDESVIFRMAEAFGSGMAVFSTCGALSAVAMVLGLKNSDGKLNGESETKGKTAKMMRPMAARFKEKTNSYLCSEIKGMETGVVLASCAECIETAVRIIGDDIFGIE